MRHAALSLIAVLFLTATISLAPARANDVQTGQNFSVALDMAQSSLAPGESLTGSITLTTFGSGDRRIPVSFEAYIKTPLGDAPLQSGSFTMRPGRTRTIPVEFVVEEDAAPGEYILKLGVTIAGESLTVTHTFTVGGKR